MSYPGVSRQLLFDYPPVTGASRQEGRAAAPTPSRLSLASPSYIRAILAPPGVRAAVPGPGASTSLGIAPSTPGIVPAGPAAPRSPSPPGAGRRWLRAGDPG